MQQTSCFVRRMGNRRRQWLKVTCDISVDVYSVAAALNVIAGCYVVGILTHNIRDTDIAVLSVVPGSKGLIRRNLWIVSLSH